MANPYGTTWILVGRPGAGKTTQALTLPRPLFCFLAETKAIGALSRDPGWGTDIQHELFIPKAVNLAVQANNAKVSDPDAIGAASETYQRLIDFVRKGVATKFFDQFKSVLFDSATPICAMLLDVATESTGHTKEGPQIGKRESNDYSKAASAFAAIVRQMQILRKQVVITVHQSDVRDPTPGGGGAIKEYMMALPGAARTIVPGIADNVFYLSMEASPGQAPKYFAQTRAQGLVKDATTTLDLPIRLDITIEDRAQPGKYGLGKIIAEHKLADGA